jgi:RNA polymerase sigma factor (sigma-70 family)
MASGRLVNSMKQIRRIALLGRGDLADAQLLDLFVSQKDEAAFEALVRRHGPMVLSVCRRILKDAHDVDDAFQATFLVLVRKAAGLAKRELVGNWLYGVAYRAALKLRQAKKTRQEKERQVQPMARTPTSSPDIPDDLLAWLDHELNQLPEKQRAAIVFCDLEGLTRTQAARKLGWPLGTLNWRLAAARAQLAKRLKRRGLGLSAAALAALLEKSAAAVVPPALVASTVKIGTVLTASGAVPSGLVSATVASLTEGVVKAMFLGKLKLVTAMVIAVGLLAAGAGGVKFGALATEQGEDLRAPTSNKNSQQIRGSSEDAKAKVQPKDMFIKAEGKVSFRIGEISGTARCVNYDESRQELLLEGTAENPVTLRRNSSTVAFQEITASKVLYNRRTGEISLNDGAKVMIGGREERREERPFPLAAKGDSQRGSLPDWQDAFLAKAHDFGAVPQGVIVRQQLPLVNKSNVSLEILGVRVSCGCLTARASAKVLTPNQEGVLLLELDSRRFTGPKTMTVFVSAAAEGKVHEFRLAVSAATFGQVDPNVVYTNQRELRIPVNVQMESGLRELLLFASWDQGRTYDQVATAAPDAREFVFKAPHDGTCWLKVAAVDREGKREPKDVRQGPVSQKLIIDTVRPQVRVFTAQRQGDDVLLEWAIEEEHLDPEGIRLEYQSKDDAWFTIPAKLGSARRARQTCTAGLSRFRLTVKDKAGNQTVATLVIESPDASLGPQAHYRLALEEIEKKNYDQARHFLRQNLEGATAVQDRAAHEKSLYKMADLCFLVKDFEQAVIYYQKALQHYPESPANLAARGQLGECYFELAAQALEKLRNARVDEKAHYD